MKVYDITDWQTGGIVEVEGEIHTQNPNCFVVLTQTQQAVSKRFIFDKNKTWFLDREEARKYLKPFAEAHYQKLQHQLIRFSKIMTELGVR